MPGASEDGVPCHEDGQGNQAADADGEVCQPALARGEAVEVDEDEGVGFKGHVEDGVAEGDVSAAGGDNGFHEDHADGPG